MSNSQTQDRQAQFHDDPLSIHPIWLPPCRVRILMVTDGSASFGLDAFGLKALLDALAMPPGPWVRFEITKAHRRNDPNADLTGFRFGKADLSGYDQIWLFGVERSGTEIDEAELSALARFMDGGGGVFATGDHEDLGVAMCGRVPRVRSMRKWYWPNPGPNGEPVAPNSANLRLDTRQPGHDATIQFDDQSDDVPQHITPRLYSTFPWNPFFHRAYPHPLLCGPRGVIRVLPDHMHEGECIEPDDLSASFTFAGYTTTEYPSAFAPEVIAWSRNQRTGLPHSFGAIGAYDGHRVDVGRVVVDATWHHYFNINVVGDLGNPDPIKAVGFDATAVGHAAYEDVKSYYRNIAMWLARESTQRCMWWRALWWTRWNHRIVMNLRQSTLERADVGELIWLGAEARDVLGRIATQCTVLRWILWHLVRPHFPEHIRELPFLDPWQRRHDADKPAIAETGSTVTLQVHSQVVLDALLGAAIQGVAMRFPVPDDEQRDAAERTDPDEILGGHLRSAMRAVGTHVRERVDELARFGAVVGDIPGED